MEELSETSQKKDKSENNNEKRTEENVIDVKNNSKNIKALENNYYNNVVNNTNKDFQFNFTDNNNISLPPDYINLQKKKQIIFNKIRNKITINTLDSFDSISMTDVSQISTPSPSSYGTLLGDQSNISDDDISQEEKLKLNLLDQKVNDILKEFDEDYMDEEIKNKENDDRHYYDVDDSCDDTLSLSTTDSEEDKIINNNNNNKLLIPENNLGVHRMSFIMQEKLHILAQNIKKRTTYVREEMIKDISSDEEDGKSVTLPVLEQQTTLMDLLGLEESVKEPTSWSDIIFKSSINSHSKGYLFWLAFVVLAFIYNALVCPLRSSYPYQTPENLKYWMMIDYTADIIYILDILFIKPRLSFMENGMLITNTVETKKHYIKSKRFIFDIIAILPTDLMYLRTGPVSLWRYNRIVKIQSYWDFFSILDNSFSNPYAIRILKTFSYMIYIIHCNSCVYYTLSAWQAFGQLAYRMRGKWYLNKWVYNNQGNSYFRCFYFTAAVATSTGNNPAPTNVIEYIYMTFSWMMGVFVFALLLGQIRDIVSNANKNKEMFRTTMDQALSECKKLNLPKELTNRVRDWFLYTWDQQKTLEEKNLVNKLPLKLQADLALSVHYNTLSKVQLFQDCERALLRELVLKLQPVIFLPGDMICRKGDVGKEMYIINQGILQVVGGDNNEIVFAEMCEGTVFGEISLMAIGGNNRRTASIRSKGYSTLFVLSKEDLNDVIKDYPEAQRLLKKKAKQMLKKDQKSKETETKDSKKDISEKCKVTAEIKTPKMFSTIANVLRPGSAISKTISEIIEHDKEDRKIRHWGTLQSDSDMSDIEFPKINIEGE